MHPLMGVTELIKIGIESTKCELGNQILMHPDRYFFILVTEGRVILCIQTCDKQGEDIKEHEIDGLKYDPDAGLISVFQEELATAMMERELFIKYLDGDRYPISPVIMKRIRGMPGLIEWIIHAILGEERCLLFFGP